MTAHIPAWPLAVLLLLVALGYKHSRPALVRPATGTTVALAMLAFSLYGVVSAFGVDPLALLAWVVGLVVATGPGRTVFAPGGLAREGAAVRVPGSWLPLVLLLGIFVSKAVLGVATGIGAAVVHEAWFAAVASAVFGLFSGGFAARAMAVRRFAGAMHAA